MVFARVANRQGLRAPRQLARWGLDHLRYRLRGSSDEQTNAVLEVAKRVFAEIPERDVERMAPEVLAGILPRIYPQMLDEVHRHQDEGRADLHRQRGRQRPGRRRWRRVLGMEGGIGTRWAVGADGVYTGEMDGPFVYGEGKVEAMRSSPRSTTSTWRSPGPTPTRPPTCRCCAPSATRSSSTRTRPLPEIARQEGWQVMRFEKLGRRSRSPAPPCSRRPPAGHRSELRSKRRNSAP